MISPVPDYPFYEPALLPDKFPDGELVEEAFVQELPYGTLNGSYSYFDGIHICSTRHQYHGHFLFEKKNDLNVVSLEFNLKGSYTIHHAGNVYRVHSGMHNIIYTPGVHNTFQNAALQAESFKVLFAPEVFLRMVEDSNDTLQRFADRMLTGQPVVIGQPSLPLNPDLQRIITEMQQCRFTGGLKKLFLLSKSIEMLVLQAEAYHKVSQSDGNQSKGIYCKRKDDQEKIRFAREYLTRHADSPPSLSELARIVGLNEYKLKRGFKEIFQTTVFGYLADFRLDAARRALLEGEKTISEIAFALGYSSPQHFSHAFKKKFGTPPRTARQ